MSSNGTGNTAIVAVSKPGAELARRLASTLPDSQLHLERRAGESAGNDARLYDLPLRPVLQDLFETCDALVVFLPIGAAVRLLAPVLGTKKQDPAVVCVDDAGRYAISVLSGHVGGADALAHRVAAAIGAQPIVTSASDALGVTAVDLVGRESGWRIEATPTDLTRAAAAVVNGRPVALWLDTDTRVPWPQDAPLSDNIVIVDTLIDTADPYYDAALLVSDRLLSSNTARPTVTYRPPTLVAGIGCRRGVTMEHIRRLLTDTLRDRGLSLQSLAKIATIDIKADEPGIISLADSLEVPLEIYSGAELNAIASQRDSAPTDHHGMNLPTPSAAQDLLGVFGVSEPAALLAAGTNRLLIPRTKSDRATVSVTRIANRPINSN